MIFNVYTVRDTVAQESGPIFTAKNDAIAFRQFSNILKETTTPKDFQLIYLGKYNTEIGKIYADEPTLVEIVDTTPLNEGV